MSLINIHLEILVYYEWFLAQMNVLFLLYFSTFFTYTEVPTQQNGTLNVFKNV